MFYNAIAHKNDTEIEIVCQKTKFIVVNISHSKCFMSKGLSLHIVKSIWAYIVTVSSKLLCDAGTQSLLRHDVMTLWWLVTNIMRACYAKTSWRYSDCVQYNAGKVRHDVGTIYTQVHVLHTMSWNRSLGMDHVYDRVHLHALTRWVQRYNNRNSHMVQLTTYINRMWITIK